MRPTSWKEGDNTKMRRPKMDFGQQSAAYTLRKKIKNAKIRRLARDLAQMKATYHLKRSRKHEDENAGEGSWAVECDVHPKNDA